MSLDAERRTPPEPGVHSERNAVTRFMPLQYATTDRKRRARLKNRTKNDKTTKEI